MAGYACGIVGDYLQLVQHKFVNFVTVQFVQFDFGILLVQQQFVQQQFVPISI